MCVLNLKIPGTDYCRSTVICVILLFWLNADPESRAETVQTTELDPGRGSRRRWERRGSRNLARRFPYVDCRVYERRYAILRYSGGEVPPRRED